MIRTPSLRGRMVLVGITALTVTTITLDTFVFLSIQGRLEHSLEEVLDAREQVVRRLAPPQGAAALARELSEAGVPAVVRDADGSVHLSDPPGQSFDVVPPDANAQDLVEHRLVALGDGIVVEVQVARGGADGTLQRLLLLEVVGTLTLLLLGLLVLRRVSALVARPVEQIVLVADAIAAGDTTRRVNPSDPNTELGRMAVAFNRTVDAMEEALSEARDAQAASRRFLSDAAHQLRTPLAGLRASAESLLRTSDAEDGDAILANIARETVRASRLVDSLLHVARLDRGDHLARESVDLLHVATEERERAVVLAPDLDVSLVTDGADFRVEGDPAAIQDALANLLDNARRHARTSIQIEVRAELGAMRLSVIDDGPGVPPGMQDEIFERFVSLDGAGSGLGLAIGRAVARSHGGDLTVNGSRFDLVIAKATL